MAHTKWPCTRETKMWPPKKKNNNNKKADEGVRIVLRRLDRVEPGILAMGTPYPVIQFKKKREKKRRPHKAVVSRGKFGRGRMATDGLRVRG